MEVKIDITNGLSGVEISSDSVRTTLNYGIRPVYSDLTTALNIKTHKQLLFYSTCGCTVATPEKTDSGYILRVKYDAKKTGAFGKTLEIIDSGIQKKTHEIILRGLIK